MLIFIKYQSTRVVCKYSHVSNLRESALLKLESFEKSEMLTPLIENLDLNNSCVDTQFHLLIFP